MINEDNQPEDVLEELPEEPEEGQEDTTDWKALAEKNQGIAKRYKTKLDKLSEKPKEEPKEEAKSEEKKPEPKEVKKPKEVLDRIDKAILSVKGITEPEEIAMVEKAKTDTGKTVEEILEATWFMAELKEYRENITSLEATPKGSQRTGNSSRDSVEYWVKKGTLPPANQTELRRKVVNAKMKQDKSKIMFTDIPVV